MFKYRFVRDEDFEMLQRWWKENKFSPPPPRLILPEEGRGGIIVSKDGRDICAGFLYLTNSTVALLEYIVMDFQVKDRVLRKEAMKFMIDSLSGVAELNDRTTLFTTIKNEGLIKTLIDCGFMVGDRNMTQLVKPV